MAITKPTVGGSTDTWGTTLNTALDELDTRVTAATKVGSVVLHARQTTSQNITDSTVAAMTFNIADRNTDAVWSAGSPTRFTPATPGWYQMSGAIAFGANATGYRSVYWYLDGVFINGTRVTVGSGGSSYVTVVNARTMPIYIAAASYVTLVGWQNSGVTLATGTSVDMHSTMSAIYLGA